MFSYILATVLVVLVKLTIPSGVPSPRYSSNVFQYLRGDPESGFSCPVPNFYVEREVSNWITCILEKKNWQEVVVNYIKLGVCNGLNSAAKKFEECRNAAKIISVQELRNFLSKRELIKEIEDTAYQDDEPSFDRDQVQVEKQLEELPSKEETFLDRDEVDNLEEGRNPRVLHKRFVKFGIQPSNKVTDQVTYYIPEKDTMAGKYTPEFDPNSRLVMGIYECISTINLH